VSLDGEFLTIEEINELLASTHGLALLRGKWVEVDPTRLRATLDKFQAIERLSEKEGVPFGQAMRLLAGPRNGRMSKPALGSPGLSRDAAVPRAWPELIQGRPYRLRFGPINRRACVGFIS
jgi:hypothetical protein